MSVPFPYIALILCALLYEKEKLDNFMCCLEFECAKRLKAYSQTIPVGVKAPTSINGGECPPQIQVNAPPLKNVLWNFAEQDKLSSEGIGVSQRWSLHLF